MQGGIQHHKGKIGINSLTVQATTPCWFLTRRWKDLWNAQNASSVGDKGFSILLTIPGFTVGIVLLPRDPNQSQTMVQTHYRKMAAVFLTQAQKMKGIQDEEECV